MDNKKLEKLNHECSLAEKKLTAARHRENYNIHIIPLYQNKGKKQCYY